MLAYTEKLLPQPALLWASDLPLGADVAAVPVLLVSKKIGTFYHMRSKWCGSCSRLARFVAAQAWRFQAGFWSASSVVTWSDCRRGRRAHPSSLFSCPCRVQAAGRGRVGAPVCAGRLKFSSWLSSRGVRAGAGGAAAGDPDEPGPSIREDRAGDVPDHAQALPHASPTLSWAISSIQVAKPCRHFVIFSVSVSCLVNYQEGEEEAGGVLGKPHPCTCDGRRCRRGRMWRRRATRPSWRSCRTRSRPSPARRRWQCCRPSWARRPRCTSPSCRPSQWPRRRWGRRAIDAVLEGNRNARGMYLSAASRLCLSLRLAAACAAFKPVTYCSFDSWSECGTVWHLTPVSKP